MDAYQINLLATNQIIFLSEVTREDIEAISSIFKFDWRYFLSRLDSDCEAIVKLESEGKIQGLIHFAFYPYPPKDGKPEYVEIVALETTQLPYRTVQPIGYYLIWYATKMSLEFGCTENDDGSIVELYSLQPVIDYYRDKVKMEGRGSVTLSPSEDGYAFRFSKEQAIKFCTRIEQEYGTPSPVREIGR
jgi:hypothetical protein